MSSAELADFWIHTVTVQTYQGTSGSGVKLYAAAATRSGFLERKRRLVRDAAGNEVVSESTLYADAALSADFAPLSKVTLPGETKPTTVITRGINASGALDLPDHIAVALQ